MSGIVRQNSSPQTELPAQPRRAASLSAPPGCAAGTRRGTTRTHRARRAHGAGGTHTAHPAHPGQAARAPRTRGTARSRAAPGPARTVPTAESTGCRRHFQLLKQVFGHRSWGSLTSPYVAFLYETPKRILKYFKLSNSQYIVNG